MWELLDWIIGPISRSFQQIYNADRRPEARRFTTGCFLGLTLIILLIGVFFKYCG
jgi:hypothetical protein